jgi:4-carboxymuconolactone decarboxylase
MEKQTAGRKALGDLAPKFAELNDDVLFGEVWSRDDKLAIRDRCLITVTALITKGVFDNSLRYHVANARRPHGVTKGRDGRSTDPFGFLCRLAQCLGGFPNRPGSLR